MRVGRHRGKHSSALAASSIADFFDLDVSKKGLNGLVYKGAALSAGAGARARARRTWHARAGQTIPLPDCVMVRVGAVVDYFGLAVLRQVSPGSAGCAALLAAVAA